LASNDYRQLPVDNLIVYCAVGQLSAVTDPDKPVLITYAGNYTSQFSLKSS
jgi:hypothetical protein